MSSKLKIMDSRNLSHDSAKAGIIKHSPEVLSGIGIAGMVTAEVLAVRATPKALSLLEERRRKEKVDDLDARETVKTVWRCYIPAIGVTMFSAVCIVCGNNVGLKRNAALAAAYSLSESTLKEYQDKIVETIGERKEQAVRDEIDKAAVEKTPMNSSLVINLPHKASLCA